MLALKRPSISPGENQARSSSTWARATAGPCAPGASGGASSAPFRRSTALRASAGAGAALWRVAAPASLPAATRKANEGDEGDERSSRCVRERHGDAGKPEFDPRIGSAPRRAL
jgi:hypothetical protein